jgi:Aerotolerance regulator N-terminal
VGLLSPWFLAGLAALGLPVYLHLLRQYKSTPKPFSSLMFFERRIQSSVKHRRLKYFLLLAVRIALLTLLALGFAQPFIRHATPIGSGRKMLVIALDRSFSIRYKGHLEEAKAKAQQWLAAAPSGQTVTVLAVDSRIETVSQPSADHTAAKTAIVSIEATDRASSFGEFARALKILASNTGSALDVRFVSDMQQTSMPPIFTDLDPGPNVALTFECVGSSKAANWAVEAVSAPAHVFDPKRARVVATINGWQTDDATRKVSLQLDGKTVQSKDVHIPVGKRAQVEFTGFDVPYGSHRGAIQIEPGNGSYRDNLPADDTYLFSMERSDPKPALFLSSGRGRDAFYYRNAVEAATDTGITLQPVSWGQGGNEDLGRYAYVAFADDSGLSTDVERRLSDYARKGGSVFVLLGAGTALRGKTPIVGDQVSQMPGNDLSALSGGRIDAQHPAMAGVGPLDAIRFNRPLHLTPQPNARVVARYSDGSPLLVEEALGEGRVLTFASGFDNLANDFPLHPSFVPFVAQIARYLAHSAETGSSVTAGLPVELRRAKEAGAAADVVGPDGTRLLSLKEASTAPSFVPEREGFYEVRRASGERGLVAVNADRRESDLSPVSQETLSLWRNMGSESGRAAAGTPRQETKPWSLWRYILLFALAASMIESVLASRYWKEERTI